MPLKKNAEKIKRLPLKPIRARPDTNDRSLARVRQQHVSRRERLEVKVARADAEPVSAGLVYGLGDGCGVEHDLFGHASDVDARASEPCALDDGGGGAMGGGALCGGNAAGASADDE